MNTRFWDFIAILFALYGLVILSAGLYYWLAGVKAYATELHPSIWWGGVMLIASVIFYFIGKYSKNE